VDAKVRADARLALGSVTDVVEVRASDIALRLTPPNLGTPVSSYAIGKCLVGRNPLRFAPW